MIHIWEDSQYCLLIALAPALVIPRYTAIALYRARDDVIRQRALILAQIPIRSPGPGRWVGAINRPSTLIKRTKVPSGTYFLSNLLGRSSNVFGRFPKQPNRWLGGSPEGPCMESSHRQIRLP